MKLSELIADLPVRITTGSGETNITDVTDDSRDVVPGALFIARRGTADDGAAYIQNACHAGAAAVLSDDEQSVPPGVAGLFTIDPQALSGVLAERVHGNPSRKLKLIGVTGTNGKTTVSHLIHQLLNASHHQSRDRNGAGCTPGRTCGLIGTIQIDDGVSMRSADLTTPPAPQLSRMLRAMVNNGCSACVMETSSHALEQGRAAALSFDIGVFTNLSGDHMDYHGSIVSYADAKSRLFDTLAKDATAVVNIDDPAATRMTRDSLAQNISCSLCDEAADVNATIHNVSIDGIDLTMNGPWGTFDVRLPLIGKHNVYNTMQAVAVAYTLGMDCDNLRNGLANAVAPPGRLEPVQMRTSNPLHACRGSDEYDNYDFNVLVDYAHTDDALDNVLSALRPLVPADSKLRVVFGCGGDRDRTKRPRMAAVACRWADHVMVTSDNPRTEDPQTIVDEVLTGVEGRDNLKVESNVDRAASIRSVIEQARPGDVVVIAGKGHEDYQIIGTTKRKFDDRIVARDALEKRMVQPVA